MEKIKSFNWGKIEYLFRVSYIIHLLLAFNAVINKTPIIKITLLITLALGGCIGLKKIYDWKKAVVCRSFWPLNIFILSYVLSAIINYRYGISGNLNGFVWLCAQIWLLYFLIDGTDIYREFLNIAKIYVFLVTIENIVNFLFFFMGFSYRRISSTGNVRMLGFHWGRLWGIYDDPNHGAVISVLAIAFAIYLYVVCEKKSRGWYIVSLVFQILYIYWSDSRTGIYSLSLFAVIWGIIVSCIKYRERNLKKCIGGCTLSVVIAIVIVLLVSPVQSISGELRNITKPLFEISIAEEDLVENDETVGREDLSSDPSNRRFEIWNSGIEIWKTKPLVGVSWPNLTAYAEKEIPETYLVNNNLQKFSSLHNMPLDVLVGQGILGIGILCWIIMGTLTFFVKQIGKIQKCDTLFVGILFSILCVSLFVSLFISSIFYVNSPESYVFWFTFGCFMYMLRKKDKKIEGNEI